MSPARFAAVAEAAQRGAPHDHWVRVVARMLRTEAAVPGDLGDPYTRLGDLYARAAVVDGLLALFALAQVGQEEPAARAAASLLPELPLAQRPLLRLAAAACLVAVSGECEACSQPGAPSTAPAYRFGVLDDSTVRRCAGCWLLNLGAFLALALAEAEGAEDRVAVSVGRCLRAPGGMEVKVVRSEQTLQGLLVVWVSREGITGNTYDERMTRGQGWSGLVETGGGAF